MSWVGLNVTLPVTNDFYPVIPWILYFLLGLWLGNVITPKELSSWKWSSYKNELFTNGRIVKFLLLSGRNSLLIYILHQPIFFSLFLIFNSIVS